MDHEVWKWAGGALAAIGAFLLKHFHGKISEAVSKTELAESLKAIAVQRAEDMARAEVYRGERRQTEKAIFDQLRDQDQTLARIDERTARWCK